MKKRKFRDNLRAYAYLSPSLIAIFILTLIPILYTFYIAFTNYNLDHMDDYTLVGFSNFGRILVGPLKPIFLPVLAWTLIYTISATAGNYFIGLIYALVLSNKNMKESGIYKGILVIPWALPGTIAILAWQGLLNENYGSINILLNKLHLINSPVHWLTDPIWARLAIIVVTIWAGFPYMMNVCLGALSAIPDTYYEAADIDGASWWQKFISITLPSLTSSSIPLLISSFAFNFNNFGAAFLITAGGPAKPDSAFAGYTDILVSSAYKTTMQLNRYDLGAALSILIFILIAIISLIQMKLSRAFEEVD